MHVSSFPIPGGDAGTSITVFFMRRMVRKVIVDPLVIRTASNLVMEAGATNQLQEALAIRDWLESYVVFTPDPQGVELLQDPRLSIQAILTRGYATLDCDDIAILGATLGLARGLRARFVLVGFHSPTAPFRHVWTELTPARGVPRWVELDTSRPQQHASVSSIRRRRDVEV